MAGLELSVSCLCLLGVWMIDVSHHTWPALRSLVRNLKVTGGQSKHHGSLHLLQALCSVTAVSTLCLESSHGTQTGAPFPIGATEA